MKNLVRLIMAASLIWSSITLAVENCHIVYDAGSSGTRMYVYEQQQERWKIHQGPKIEALADPIREIRGKTQQDIPEVIANLVATLEQIKTAGPNDQAGQPIWRGFNWSSSCRLQSVLVYATAGMRLAEQAYPQQSQQLWNDLHQALREKLPSSVYIATRTLTGYEEGLYAWLAVRDQTGEESFGIVEMGGASTQVTFPCLGCSASDALKPVLIGDKSLSIFSYSFLGLGQDEAPKVLGLPESCQYGVGQKQPEWQLSLCQEQLHFTQAKALLDPYNFHNEKQGQYYQIPIEQGSQTQWYLTGGFNYRQASDEQECCLNAGQCHTPQTSCFRVAYLPKYLAALNVPNEAPTQDVDWPLGAVICQSGDCLRKAKPLVCRWNEQGCL